MKRQIGFIVLACCLATLSAQADTTSDVDPLLSQEEGLPNPTASGAGDNPAPTLGADNPVPVPEAQPALPLTSIPGKTPDSPTIAPEAAVQDKDIYEQYDDYLDRENSKQQHESTYSKRNLFPHENGGWQLGLVYARNAFTGYDFNWNKGTGAIHPETKVYAESQGINLNITYFPIRSLSIGRLGIGLVGGIYWTSFNIVTSHIVDATGVAAGNAETKASPQQITSYGGRIVYEFDYWLGQIIVPFAFYGEERVQIRGYNVSAGSQAGVTTTFLNIPARQVTSASFGGGARFNLNRVEPSVASKALVNTGVKKFYLTYAAVQRVGTFSGLNHNLGLDFEF